MKLPRPPGRFEWKILSALFIVASLSFAGATYLTWLMIGCVQVITEQY